MFSFLFGTNVALSETDVIDQAALFKKQVIEAISNRRMAFTDITETSDRFRYNLGGKISRGVNTPAHDLTVIINMDSADVTISKVHTIWTQINGPRGATADHNVAQNKDTLPLAEQNAEWIATTLRAFDYDPQKPTVNDRSPEMLLIDHATQFKNQVVEEIGKLGLVFKTVAETRDRANYDLTGKISQGSSMPQHDMTIVINMDRAQVDVWNVQTIWAQINGAQGATMSKDIKQGKATQSLAQETARWAQSNLTQFDYKPQVA